MKYLSALFLLMGLSLVGFGQSNREDVDVIQAVFGKEKKSLMASFIQLDSSKSKAFWKLYDEYETSRKALGRKRIELLEKYADKYTTMDDKTTDELMKETQSLQVQTDKLVVEYYGKVKATAGVKAAAQFYQMEAYLLSIVRATILDRIPFIGELDEKRK